MPHAKILVGVERLPTYPPEPNPGEGLWQQLKGVELRDAVKRVRRKLRLSKCKTISWYHGRRKQRLLELQLADGCTVGAGRSQVTQGQRQRAAIGGSAHGWIVTDKYDMVLTLLQV